MPAKTSDRVKEILRLYSENLWTLEQIGAHFGVTRQAVQAQVARAKIKLPSIKRAGRLRKVLDRESLIQLYEIERQTIAQIACNLETSRHKVAEELARYGIAKRSPIIQQRKHPEFYEMKAGESITINSPAVKNPYRNLHAKAFKRGIKITVKRTDSESFEVTRIK